MAVVHCFVWPSYVAWTGRKRRNERNKKINGKKKEGDKIMTGRQRERRVARWEEIGAIIQLAAGAEGILSCHRSQSCRRRCKSFCCIWVLLCVCAAPSYCFVAAYFVWPFLPTLPVLCFFFFYPHLSFFFKFSVLFITNIHLPPNLSFICSFNFWKKKPHPHIPQLILLDFLSLSFLSCSSAHVGTSALCPWCCSLAPGGVNS